jgi:hypothetical protein
LTALQPELEQGKYAAASRYRSRLTWINHPTDGRKLVDVPVNVPGVEQILNERPEWLTYADFSLLYEASPEAAARFWQQIRTSARDAMASGHYAARKTEPDGARPYQRATFLELRQALVEEWQPQGATELMLIDNLAQAHLMRNSWLACAVNYEDPPPLTPAPPPGVETREEREKREHEEQMQAYLPPRLTAAQATERALEMVERWDRMLIRTVRALRDLRRYAPVVIQNAPGGQVNVGQQQVNVAAANQTMPEAALTVTGVAHGSGG